MRDFAALYAALDAATGTDAKVVALVAYLQQADATDAAWGVYLLAGGRPPRAVPRAVMLAAATEAAGLPDWLFDLSYQAVGDLSETIAQLLPPAPGHSAPGLALWMNQRLPALRTQAPDQQRATLQRWWAELGSAERFLLGKLIGGGFRVGVSRLLVQRALAQHAQLPPALVAQRMMGYTQARHRPDAAALAALLAPDDGAAGAPTSPGQPYPFYLAHALNLASAMPSALQDQLGPVDDWQAEWKYDGMRAQLVRRAGGTWLWSRGEELLAGRFPEVEALAMALPDGTVLDGELLVWLPGQAEPAAFALLQQRINRKSLSTALLSTAPVVFVAYDLLELAGADQRALPQQQRRQLLQTLLVGRPWRLSPLLQARSWDDLAVQRERSRALGVEGLMLKHRWAPYGLGRTKTPGLAQGGWWKWKVAPMRVDGVLLYAQAGHGRRAGLYTDYTFAVWNRRPHDAAEAQAVVDAIARREPPAADGLQLVAFTKAYSGLSDAEFTQVDQLIRRSTLERFGPVRSLKPSLLLEIGFEGIQLSARHKSGLALRFPRMLRLRPDKPLHEGDTLESLRAMIKP